MSDAPAKPAVIIAGFGLPGRVVAEKLCAMGVPHCVIDLNPQTAQRCARVGMSIIVGNCADPQVLLQAGIEQAEAFIVVVPDEKAALQATQHARQLNSSIHIITRCYYTSAGIQAKSLGANEVIVAEQVVAEEVLRRITGRWPKSPSANEKQF